MNLPELVAEMRRLSALLDKGVDALRETARALADAEHDYRLARAKAFTQAPEGMTVDERKAEKCSGDEHLATCWGQGDLPLMRAALEAVLDTLPAVEYEVWCEAHDGVRWPSRDVTRSLSNGCCATGFHVCGDHDVRAPCPGPHRRLLIGPPVLPEEDN